MEVIVSDGRETRQYGLWSSPISAAGLAGGVRISDVLWTSDGRALVWREERSGVGVLVCREGGDAPRELTEGTSVRARVGYGGAAFAVSDEAAFYVEQASGRLFRIPLSGGAPRAITPGFGFAAAPAVSPDGAWVLYVHTYEAADRIAIVDAEGREWPRVFASGRDFYMQPVWSGDGRRAAWVAWDHPAMPFDETVLELVDVDRSETVPRPSAAPRVVAGGDDVAVFQPEFLRGDRIAYVSDESGWGRLVVRDLVGDDEQSYGAKAIELGAPAWIQGLRTYAPFPSGDRFFVTLNENDFVTPALLDTSSGEIARLEADGYTAVLQPSLDPSSGRVAAIASSSSIPPRVVEIDLASGATTTVRRTAAENVASGDLSAPEARTWPSLDGRPVHGLYYPPASSKFVSEGRPPLVVLIHGGPTTQSIAAWSAQVQFLATRGYGVLVVNYRGSTGHGREYMTALRGNWGVLDVEDAVSGAKSLADDERVDGERMAIMGGSAGGFTVLQTMIVHPEVFAAGVCLFGVSNQFTLAAETHKFEARYLDSLLGPLPDAAAIYRERSPQFRASEIRRPLAIFQGEIDEVVPKAQSDAIVAALERNGTPHEYHVYAGEGHGWRRAETIEAFYTSLERFLRQWLVFA
jgi:dipeptidyl aminopeptidase/acylaminoacyl peptidase